MKKTKLFAREFKEINEKHKKAWVKTVKNLTTANILKP